MIKLMMIATVILGLLYAGATYGLFRWVRSNDLVTSITQKVPMITKVLPVESVVTATDAANISLEKVPDEIVDDAASQLQVLGVRAQEVGTQAQGILNESVKVNDQSKPSQALHERALEYTQYLYCQDVVRQYKEKYPSN